MTAVSPLVFVVDDDPSVRKGLTRLLVSSGYAVETFASAGEFLAREPHPGPSCLVLDVRMPGLNGPETSRLIRASGARSVVVLVSALSRPELPDSVEECGAAAVLHKCELSPRRLVTLLQDLHSQPAGLTPAAAGS